MTVYKSGTIIASRANLHDCKGTKNIDPKPLKGLILYGL